MNTLPRAITARFFSDPAIYHALRSRWRTLMQSSDKHELAAEHHLLYLALLGKDWRKGFTPITNQRKLSNGAFEGWALFEALRLLRFNREEWLLAPFDGIVTSAMFQQVRQLIAQPHASQYHAADFTTTSFPFDAYCMPETQPTLAAE